MFFISFCSWHLLDFSEKRRQCGMISVLQSLLHSQSLIFLFFSYKNQLMVTFRFLRTLIPTPPDSIVLVCFNWSSNKVLFLLFDSGDSSLLSKEVDNRLLLSANMRYLFRGGLSSFLGLLDRDVSNETVSFRLVLILVSLFCFSCSLGIAESNPLFYRHPVHFFSFYESYFMPDSFLLSTNLSI